ncbi:hypothetical protein W01_03340 [Candidatus Nitrotoga sp. AM1P]|nr:hypothetical protein W01_03340 [Candidatus Nitrotoga sp. AM1P]
MMRTINKFVRGGNFAQVKTDHFGFGGLTVKHSSVVALPYVLKGNKIKGKKQLPLNETVTTSTAWS